MTGYLYGLGTMVLASLGQLIIKWQASDAGEFTGSFVDRARYLGALLVNPWVIGSLAAAFVAALLWIAALSTLDLNRAYPLAGISFVLVLMLSALVLKEQIGAAQVIGTALIVGGILVTTRA